MSSKRADRVGSSSPGSARWTQRTGRRTPSSRAGWSAATPPTQRSGRGDHAHVDHELHPAGDQQPVGCPEPRRERAEGLLFRLPVGIAVVDRRYDVVTINAVARRACGIHGAAIGEDFVHLAPGVDPAALRAAIDAAFRGQVARLDEVAVALAGSSYVN